jgi:DNA repair protein RecN (Recombination protein N)
VKLLVLELNKLKSNYSKLKANKTESTRELEFAQFQLTELEALELEKYNFEELEEELNRIDKLDELKTTYSSIIQALDNENGVLDTIRVVKAIVEKWKHSDAKLAEFSQRIESSFYELQDVSAEAQNQLENLEMNPERFEFLTSKLDKYNSCLSKNACKNQSELQTRYNELVNLVSTLDASDERLLELEKEISIKELEAKNKANQLFEKRITSSKELKKHLLDLLSDLKLQSAKLDFDLVQLNELDPNGGMSIQLLFSANDGMDLRPIEKTASGGELSRLMLAIQATMSEKKSLPTLILDEIDTGVSGEVALRIGQLLQKMGQSIQVFAITHLPQVAAKGQSHLEVRKISEEGKTITQISHLEPEERVDAIAKLMSGETITLIAQQNAQQLLEI